MIQLSLAAACTYFELPSPGEDDLVIGRTMELGVFPGIVWMTVAYPRGTTYRISSSLHGGVKKAKYAIVSLESKRILGVPPICFDGMNEVGLTIAALTLRASGYQKGRSENDTIGHLFFTRWVLSEFNSTAAVKAALPHVVVTGSLEVTGLHYAITDATGDSIVAEYIAGELKIFKNDVRVLTNDPTYEWQVMNLNSYVSLSPYTPDGNNKGIEVSTEFGSIPANGNHGFNLQGLPGDMGPPARFVRMFYLKQYAMFNSPPKTTDDTMVLATALLNNVFLAKGTIAKSSSLDGFETTNFGLVKLPKAGKIFIRSYRNMQWKLVDLKKLSFQNEHSFPVEDGSLGIKDVSAQLEDSTLMV